MSEKKPKRIRHKRTRTGCERCRGQRRKCDEKRPQCSRCVHAGAACRYVVNVSFQDKNSHTISNEASSTATNGSVKPAYPTLEFIVDEIPCGQKKTQNGPSTPNSDVAHPSQQAPTLPRNSIDWESKEAWPLVGNSSLSKEEADLLKYYCHRIAPWLDVYDSSRTYRLLFTRLAMGSPAVLEQLLKLSAAFSGRPMDIVKPRGTALLHLQAMFSPPSVRSPFPAVRVMAGFVLSKTMLFVRDIPRTWGTAFQSPEAFPPFDQFKIIDPTDRKIWLSFLTQMLRLEIGYSLMYRQPPTVAYRLGGQIREIQETYKVEIDDTQKSFNACLACLGLLAETMILYFPLSSGPKGGDANVYNNPSSLLTDASDVNTWKTLFMKLLKWHLNRPPDLQELMESDEPGAVFPTVIFCTGAGISSNVLYHAAMSLILSYAPDQTYFDEWALEIELESPKMSPVWHASRVCGIAINSEPEHTLCWDPCMMSALAFAARCITDTSERYAIINCLRRVELAGWHVDSLIRRLHDGWEGEVIY
ncbi:hypothetical protein F5Y16DRAFT_380068 [Xylariaceae sp. FL0255]|nr:hypothetical protein F5Y16DRAFT_380068 [Xylariaceae sp. FL0255]